MVPNVSYNKKMKSNNKPFRLNQCDIEILKMLRKGAVEVLKIHERLPDYTDQEVSLNLSWLERKGFIKKVVYAHPAGFQTVSFQLDTLGKEFAYRRI